MKFTESANKGWYQKGNYLYNNSLQTEEIKPGQTKELKLVLTMALNENNTGLVNNLAKIEESHDKTGGSTLNSKVSDSADVIIGIRTGELPAIIIISITIASLIGAAAYIIFKKQIISKINF